MDGERKWRATLTTELACRRALDGGCDSIEHGLEITDAQIAQMKRQGTWYCPTLAPYYGDWAPADTPGGKRDRARAAVHEISFRKAHAGASENRVTARIWEEFLGRNRLRRNLGGWFHWG